MRAAYSGRRSSEFESAAENGWWNSGSGILRVTPAMRSATSQSERGVPLCEAAPAIFSLAPAKCPLVAVVIGAKTEGFREATAGNGSGDGEVAGGTPARRSQSDEIRVCTAGSPRGVFNAGGAQQLVAGITTVSGGVTANRSFNGVPEWAFGVTAG